MKKYIFLDFDGVLNTEQHISCLKAEGLPISNKYGYVFDPDAVDNLAAIVEKTEAEIVITSSWRIEGLETMQQLWLDLELPGVIAGITPFEGVEIDANTPDTCAGRGNEIDLWLKEHCAEEDRYVIIDDVDDVLPHQKSFFVQTDPYVGITDYDYHAAVKILNRLGPAYDNYRNQFIAQFGGATSDLLTQLFINAIKCAEKGDLEEAVAIMNDAIVFLRYSRIGDEVIYIYGFYCEICLDANRYSRAKILFDLGLSRINQLKESEQNTSEYEDYMNMFLPLQTRIEELFDEDVID